MVNPGRLKPIAAVGYLKKSYVEKLLPSFGRKSVSKFHGHIPHLQKKIAKGAYTDTKLCIHSRGQSKPAASFSDVTSCVKNEDVTNDMT